MLRTVSKWCHIHLNAAALVSILGGALLPAPADAFAVYTDRTLWEAALAGYTIVNDTFENVKPPALSITFDSGVVSTGSPGFIASSGNRAFGAYSAVVDGGESGLSDYYDTITWTFPLSIMGVGMDLRFASVLDVLTIGGDFDGTGDVVINVADYLTYPGEGFLGVVGTAPFTSITFGDADARGSIDSFQYFYVDRLSFAVATQVPEPATLALFGVGLAGLGWVARRGKQKAVEAAPGLA